MSKPYQTLAQYYDRFFAAFRSPLDAARHRALGRILSRVELACELGCGTGATALSLARMGITTYAVDLAPLMCRLVRAKARRARLPVRVIRADMRTFRLPQTVDLITCEGDALNHVPHKTDLKRIARAVHRTLRPGGHFFFDVNNSLGFERYWSGISWFEKPGVVLVMRNGHNREADRAWSDVEWFIRDGNSWRRRQERVEEVCWDSEEIHQTFSDAGFDHLPLASSRPSWMRGGRVRRVRSSLPAAAHSTWRANPAAECAFPVVRYDRLRL